ncbi:MAG: dihydroxyacetone kinase phosphoryl donor subunit DhaM [Chloroflexota bacterium]
MIAIVLVSHSHYVARGTKDLADQMSQGRVKIFSAGGLDETNIGTNVERIHKALTDAMNPDGVLVLLDLGSAVLSAQMAVDMLPEADQQRVLLSEAPLVEGAIIAAVEASLGHDLEKVNAAAEATSTMRKLP